MPEVIYRDLRALVGGRDVVGEPRLAVWPGQHSPSDTAAVLAVRVSLPSRGPIDDINLRPLEPVILRFTADYPYECPRVFSDRRDFPAERLPHLNAVPPGTPASLCLHPASLDEWFASSDLPDVVQRTAQWLSDAASGLLVRPGEGFEPVRLPFEACRGLCEFRPDRVAGVCGTRLTHHSGGRTWTPAAFSALPLAVGGAVYWVAQLRQELSLSQAQWLLRLVGPLDRERVVPGVVAWTAESVGTYDTCLPTNCRELCAYARRLGIDCLPKALDELRSEAHLPLPVLLVIRRPQTVIGTAGSQETLSFVLFHDNVVPLLHSAPYRPALARHTSRVAGSRDPSVVVVGAGAVGSKIAVHLARAGFCRLTIVDPDVLRPHNMARHALLAESVHRNKAEATSDAIRRIYGAGIPQSSLTAVPKSVVAAHRESPGLLNDSSLIVDCSASAVVRRYLADCGQQLPRTVSCSLVQRGRLGIMAAEGLRGNPSVRDLDAFTWDAAIENGHLSEWLAGRASWADLEELPLGVGCSTYTMRVADDTVSAHAALMATRLRWLMEHADEPPGSVFTSLVDADGTAGSWCLSLASVAVLSARMSPHWQVRVFPGAAAEMQRLRRSRLPNETGGLLFGVTSLRERVIRITRAEPAPRDSAERPYAFVRGTSGLSHRVIEVEARTGERITYAGEWHTHRGANAEASPQDLESLQAIAGDLRRDGLPAHVMVVADGEFRSYVTGT